MSLKDVKDYHMKMTSDYMQMKKTIDQLESEISPEKSTEALANLNRIKESAKAVEVNYNRINYIMYLLNMPTRKKKQLKYENQHKKQLNNISEKDRLEGIQKENKENISTLKQYL